MRIDLGVYIVFALLACWPLLMIFLPVISRTMKPGMRFKVASVIVYVFWSIAGVMLAQHDSNFSIWQWAAGFLLITAVLLFAFMLWSVLCWGYTISMLLCLAPNHQVNSIDEWMQLYTRSQGTRVLTENRVEVLTSLHLARLDNEEVVLTRIGFIVAECIKKIFFLLGVK